MANLDLHFVSKVVNYYNSNSSTVRETAAYFGISKSTVYRYITETMPNPDSAKIIETNKSERHIRGGQAFKNKCYTLRRCDDRF